jgi:MFS family permease
LKVRGTPGQKFSGRRGPGPCGRAASRWGAGGIADRFGGAAAIAPLLFTGAPGLAAIGLGADSVHDAPGRALVLSGLLLTGVAYGGLQSVTLAQAFTAAGEPARSSVSIAWNLSFDAGTGLGAFTAGAIATATSYSAAFIVLALAVGIVAGCSLLISLLGKVKKNCKNEL